MEPSQFDDLTKSLATATSRRQALKTLAATTLGGILGLSGLGTAFGKNKTCAQFCASVFGANTPAAEQCTSDAAHGTGLCYQCGPAAPANHPPLCGQVCCPAPPANATATCTSGMCGFVCNSGYKTCNSTCIPNDQCCGDCPSGQTCCNGTCTALTTTQNCGSCGTTCTGTTPACCSGHCKDLSNDVNNCGACGHVCGGGQTCQNGTCGGVPTCTFECPPQDLGGRTLQSQSSTSTQVVCQYQTVPNTSSCTYFADTGLLKQDNDGGLCPPVAVPFCS